MYFSNWFSILKLNISQERLVRLFVQKNETYVFSRLTRDFERSSSRRNPTNNVYMRTISKGREGNDSKGEKYARECKNKSAFKSRHADIKFFFFFRFEACVFETRLEDDSFTHVYLPLHTKCTIYADRTTRTLLLGRCLPTDCGGHE